VPTAAGDTIYAGPAGASYAELAAMVGAASAPPPDAGATADAESDSPDAGDSLAPDAGAPPEPRVDAAAGGTGGSAGTGGTGVTAPSSGRSGPTRSARAWISLSVSARSARPQPHQDRWDIRTR